MVNGHGFASSKTTDFLVHFVTQRRNRRSKVGVQWHSKLNLLCHCAPTLVLRFLRWVAKCTNKWHSAIADGSKKSRGFVRAFLYCSLSAPPKCNSLVLGWATYGQTLSQSDCAMKDGKRTNRETSKLAHNVLTRIEIALQPSTAIQKLIH